MKTVWAGTQVDTREQPPRQSSFNVLGLVHFTDICLDALNARNEVIPLVFFLHYYDFPIVIKSSLLKISKPEFNRHNIAVRP